MYVCVSEYAPKTCKQRSALEEQVSKQESGERSSLTGTGVCVSVL